MELPGLGSIGFTLVFVLGFWRLQKRRIVPLRHEPVIIGKQADVSMDAVDSKRSDYQARECPCGLCALNETPKPARLQMGQPVRNVEQERTLRPRHPIRLVPRMAAAG
jgi:hypothetical protein